VQQFWRLILWVQPLWVQPGRQGPAVPMLLEHEPLSEFPDNGSVVKTSNNGVGE
jgi:hypothetical protein